MNMQTSYPVFESGQVLSSSHLNDLVEYLEQQDRLTRSKLIGIGVVCGFDVAFEPQENRIRIAKGTAVTSEGYLICQDECLLDRFREYTLPVPRLEEAPQDLIDASRYPFFFDTNGEQISLWELLPTDHEPAPGDPAPTSIDAAFLSDKVVLLYLECNLESLKNCDVNDCSDKGAQMNFTLRKLLLTKDDARAILTQEANIAERPVDRHNHPRYDLKELRIAKINPSRHEIDNFAELLFRILSITFELAPDLVDGLRRSSDAYTHFIGDLYPPTEFPGGPFGSSDYFNNVLAQLLRNIFLAQYFYDYLYDVVQSYNEFLTAACRLDAECCPDSERFPKHVLLGEIAERPIAFTTPLSQPGEVLSFDPLTANSEAGPTPKPAPFRHHFVPSPLIDRQHEELQRVRTLHLRMHQLAFRYSTEGLMLADIKITPSKNGDYTLSETSVPFYYKFMFADHFHRCWSFDKTIKNQLDQVLSHPFIDTADHPLLRKMDGHNFYRIEGHVGKPLGRVMRELLDQKRQLGLSVAFEPVYIGLNLQDDLSSIALNQEARTRAQRALMKLLLCRMRDLDVVFLILMAVIFYYLFVIISLISGLNTSAVAKLAAVGPISRGDATPDGATSEAVALKLSRVPKRADIDRKVTDATLREVRLIDYRKGRITEKVTKVKDAKQSIGQLYGEIKESSTTENLFDRTVAFAKTLDPDGDAEVVARDIYRPINVLDQAEGLLETVSATSIAEFDFEQFDAKYEGFVRAFDSYASNVVSAEAETDTSVATTNELLVTNYGAIAATTPQAVVANLAIELQERLNRIFQELLLGEYAKRHPGLEHKAGAFVGGTVALLYTHKNFIAQILSNNKSSVDTRVAETYARYAATPAAAVEVSDPNEVLSAVPPATDELDDFIVLGDMTVPYLCCDTDCSDIDLEPAERTEPAPALVQGTIFGRATRGGRTGNPTIRQNAVVTVTNMGTKLPVDVTFDAGNYAFTGPPGTYRIEAAAPQLATQGRIITVGEDSSKTEDFVLTSNA